MDLAEATLGYARSQLGVEEHPRGSNAGPEVERYQQYVGLHPGQAWCAAFVSYCTGTSAADLCTTSTLKPSGSALALYFKNPGLAIDAPTDRCIGVMDHGGGLGHAFFIETTTGDSCHTIEGNGNPEGGREGYAVVEHDRPTSTITYFLRICVTMFTRLHLKQPPTTKKVVELAVTGWLGNLMSSHNWAGTTIPLPFLILILYWMPQDPLMPYFRVHEFTHVQQDVDARFWFVAWVRYGWQMIRNFAYRAVLTRKTSITQAAFDDYRANPYEQQAYDAEDQAFKNGLPDWATP